MYFPVPEYGYWPATLDGRIPDVSVPIDLPPATGAAQSLHVWHVGDWTYVTATTCGEGVDDWRFPGFVPPAIVQGEYIRAWHLSESSDGSIGPWQALYGPTYNR